LFSLTEGNGYDHEGAIHRFVMRVLEEEEVGSNSSLSDCTLLNSLLSERSIKSSILMSVSVMPHLRAFLGAASSLSMLARDKNPEEPVSLMLDNKRPDGTRGKPMTWDVTVLDTYAESHIANTATTPGAAAHTA